MVDTDTGYVIPTLGSRPDWLCACLASVLAQPEVAKVVVVAPEGSKDLAIGPNERVVFVRDSDRGLSAAINDGMDRLSTEAKVRFVSWLGDDDLLAPGAVGAARAALMRSPNAGFAFGRVRYIDEKGVPMWLLRPGRWALWYSRWGRNFIQQPGSLIRLSAWKSVGGLDEALQNSMDQDLFLHIARDYESIYVPRELAAYRIHSASISSQKGTRDESVIVGDRYRRDEGAPKSATSRAAIRVTDRFLLSAHKRIPGPSVPLVHGLPYTMGGPVRECE